MRSKGAAKMHIPGGCALRESTTRLERVEKADPYEKGKASGVETAACGEKQDTEPN